MGVIIYNIERQRFRGVEGIFNFHNDIIIYGTPPAEHHTYVIGAPANPDKTNTIDQGGSHNSEEEEVRIFLQDRSINDKFTFNHGERKSYKDITIHLRDTVTKKERLKRAEKR